MISFNLMYVIVGGVAMQDIFWASSEAVYWIEMCSW
jgi:hypothetical protein